MSQTYNQTQHAISRLLAGCLLAWFGATVSAQAAVTDVQINALIS